MTNCCGIAGLSGSIAAGGNKGCKESFPGRNQRGSGGRAKSHAERLPKCRPWTSCSRPSGLELVKK